MLANFPVSSSILLADYKLKLNEHTQLLFLANFSISSGIVLADYKTKFKRLIQDYNEMHYNF